MQWRSLDLRPLNQILLLSRIKAKQTIFVDVTLQLPPQELEGWMKDRMGSEEDL